MERGEAGILGGQFVALAVALLVLSNFVGATSPLSSPTIGKVYWGGPTSTQALTQNVANVEHANATTISVFYKLAPSTTPAEASATRLCLDVNDTGQVYNYVNIALLDSPKGHYISFGPVDQGSTVTCTYTVTLTDSLQQVTTWVAIVQVKNTT